jgi:hypothetical protein
MKLNKPKILIGVDGGKNCGFAVYDNVAEKFISIETLDFWRVYNKITSSFLRIETEIIVEKLNPTGALYARTDGKTAKGRDRFAANVGGARRETDLLIEGLELAGFTVRKVKPVKAAKWTPDDLARFCKWTKQTSEHGRDAARIIFHR